MAEIPPRFTPDNTKEGMARRKAVYSWGGALVTEVPKAYDNALAWITPVVELKPKEDPPDIAA